MNAIAFMSPQYQETNTIMAQSENSAQSKLEQFLSEYLDTPTAKGVTENRLPKREPIKHILTGSSKAVISTIHYLQVIGYASVGDWSPLVPTDNPDEVMSILIRQILMQ
jgi:hypothetical protein